MSLLEEIKLALHYTRRSRAPFACGGRSQRRHGTITVPTGNANCALRGRFGKPCRWDNRVSQGWAASALQARCVNRLCEGGLGGRDARIGSVRGMTVLQTYERKAALKWRAKPLLQEEAQKFAPRWRRATLLQKVRGRGCVQKRHCLPFKGCCSAFSGTTICRKRFTRIIPF